MTRQNHNLLPLLIFLVLLILAVTFIDLPGNTKFVQELQNTGHTFVFGVAALFSLKLLRSTKGFNSRSVWRQYLIVFWLCLFSGIIVELLQLAIHRDADMIDVVRDIAGIVAFLGFYSLVDRTITARFKENKATVLSGALIGLIALSLALFPISRLTYVYYQRYQAYPIIMDFNSGWFNDFVSTQDAKLVVVAAPDDWIQESGKSVAAITLQPTQYPGFHIDEPASDWAGYSYLNFKIFSTNPNEATLVIRIHDRPHNQQFNDRFNRRIKIRHGENVFRVDLKSVQNAPTQREMNMKVIAGVELFAVEPREPLKFYLSNIWLD